MPSKHRLLACGFHRRHARRADEIVAKIIGRIATLQTFPMLGLACPNFDEMARALAVVRWIVVYSVFVDEVSIVRIIDAASDILRELTGPST
ncbi:MAG: hypothetical protein EOO82_02590 [Oxalobacteraceae bacterium]|nr:MAG: hypothetical protein EOO82_02590 [Oxalobacteraceae bacterium]